MTTTLETTPTFGEVTAFLRESNGYVQMKGSMAYIVPRDMEYGHRKQAVHKDQIQFMIERRLLIGRLRGHDVLYELAKES